MAGSTGNSIEIGQSEQELVNSKNGNRLKRRLCIALIMLVVVGVCASLLIYFGAIRPNYPANAQELHGEPIKLADVLDNKFYARHNNASWVSDTGLIYRDIYGNIVTFDVSKNKSEIIAGVDIPIVATAYSYELSPDRRYLLLARDYQKIFRHSGVAYYDILDLYNNVVYRLSENLLELAEWGPKGNSIVFIQDNNLYYKPSVAQPIVQITNDGNVNLFNGICDWVYEEEVFSTKTAVWISPDNTKLAFVQFNDSSVNHINIPIYGTPGVEQNQYPSAVEFPYPKTGSSNPTVKLFLVNLAAAKPNQAVTKVQVPAPKDFLDQEHIVSVVAWANDRELISTWMNRVQNRAIVQLCNTTGCSELMNAQSKTGWIDFFEAPKFNADGSKFVYIRPQEQASSNDSYQHLTLVEVKSGKQTPLTSGEFVVFKSLHWDEKNNRIFYEANGKNAPHIKHIWSTQASDVDSGSRTFTCWTCNITRDGIVQTYYTAAISKRGSYMMISNEGPSIPRTDVVQFPKNSTDGKLLFVRNWEQNHGLHAILSKSTRPIIEYHRIPLKSGYEASIKIQFPPDADFTAKQKYPMLIDVYAGPGSFAGTDRWDTTFATYLVTNRKYILVQINGRGSGYRGQNLLHEIYRQMGTVEVQDQLETAQKLTEYYEFIDKKRVGIWGWSYGGFAAGMALAADNSSVLRCAASVAPVTDWIYYDTIYTERYMGLPTKRDNSAGYERARLSTRAEDFRNKTYLLIHGSLDDNVHYQQAMALARTLEVSDIPFEQITYPDEDHSLWGVRKHLFHALDKYFNKCFT